MKDSPAKKQSPAPVLITFGRGGHKVYYEPQEQRGATTHQSCSGYSTPETIFALRPSHRPGGPDARDHDPMEFQGVPVIDMREAAGTKAGIHMAISGPMVQPGLKDQEVLQCPTPSKMLVDGLAGNSMGDLAQLHQAQRASGVRAGALDMVSVPEYIRLWRQAGAKIGAVRGMVIEFEQPAKLPPGPVENQDELLLGALTPPVVEEPKKGKKARPLASPEV